MKLIHILTAFMASLCLSACSGSPDPPELDTLVEGKPSLWKVTGTKPEQKGSAYLFGTIHILPEDARWRTPKLETAISNSDRLIIEVLGLEDKKAAGKTFTKLAISPDQEPVEKRLKPELRDDLDKVLTDINISEIALNRMESWAVALSLASAQTRQLGLISDEGVENKLSNQFNQMKKPIEGLETIEQQLGYFDKLPEKQQLVMLTSVLEEQDNAKNAFENLFNAWISGDDGKLVELSDGGILEDPTVRENILIKRNLDWANQLDSKLQYPGISFVAVGAAHLVGPDAVQQTLQQRGYEIEKIQ